MPKFKVSVLAPYYIVPPCCKTAAVAFKVLFFVILEGKSVSFVHVCVCDSWKTAQTG